jgi:hypothetical protein
MNDAHAYEMQCKCGSQTPRVLHRGPGVPMPAFKFARRSAPPLSTSFSALPSSLSPSVAWASLLPSSLSAPLVNADVGAPP